MPARPPRIPPHPRLLAGALASLLLLAACGLPGPRPDRAPADPLAGAPPAAGAAPAMPEAGSGFAAQAGRLLQRQGVVAAHPLAAEAGAQVLREGGSAVDAAVAVQMVLALVEPQSSGLGGGAFLLLWDGRTVQAWDGRETAPAAADEGLFLRPDGRPMPFFDAVAGGRAVGVPGAVRMLEAVHRRHGRLPWARLLQPAIDLAEQGVPVSPRLHTLLAWAAPRLRQDAQAAAHFYQPGCGPRPAGAAAADRPPSAIAAASGTDPAAAAGPGTISACRPWPVGHRLRNPALAAVLRAIAEQGSAALHAGPVAADIVARVRGHAGNPGRLDLADLAGYRPIERTALCTVWRVRWRVCGFPPPSSGHLALMQLLQLFDLARPDAGAPADGVPGADWLHAWAEASRLAWADRAQHVADPGFVPAPAGRWGSLLDADYLRQRAALIGPRRMADPPPGQPAGSRQAWAPQAEQPEFGTSHLSIVDGRGQAVAMTTSIEFAFGAQLMSDGGSGLPGGFLLNNQLTDFAFQPRGADGRPVANRLQPGKRPRSSMAPTLVFDARDGRLLLVAGSPGGPAIVHFTARALLATLGWGLDPQAAAAAPNAAQLGGPLLLEAGRFPAATQDALRALGHPVQATELTSGLHLLQRWPGGWFGGADPRREGVVAGD